jgi:cyanate permease
MGTVMGVLTLASLFFAPLGGGLGDRFGPRWTVGVAVLIIAVAGALRAAVDSVFSLTVCMFTMGAGIAIFGPNLPKALSMWFPKNEMAMANGISMAGMGVGGAIGMGIAASVMSPLFGGWRPSMVWVGGFMLAAGVLWMLIFRDKTADAGPAVSRNIATNFKTVLKIKDVWLLAIFYGLNMVGIMTVVSLLPISLAERGVEKSGELVAIMMGVAVVFNIVGGILSDKTGKRKPFLILCAVILAVCIVCFATTTGIGLIIALACAGAAMGTIAPIIMVVPVEMERVGPALTATAMGFIFMLGNTGGFIGPVAGGKLMDAYGLVTGYMVIGAALILASLVILPLKETGTRKTKGR